MYKHCTTEESYLRQRQIEGCLLDLMLTYPYPQITITHICESIGISRKSFYRYFGSKDDCLHGLIDHCILDGASSYLPEHNIRPTYHQFFSRFFSYWRQQAVLINVLVRNDLSGLLIERMMVHIDQEERTAFYYLGSDTDASYEQVLFMVCGLSGLLIQWYSTGFLKSSEQMAEIMTRILTK